MITKELILEILLTKDYLWDVIDNFINMNPDNTSLYYKFINEMYSNTIKPIRINLFTFLQQIISVTIVPFLSFNFLEPFYYLKSQECINLTHYYTERWAIAMNLMPSIIIHMTRKSTQNNLEKIYEKIKFRVIFVNFIALFISFRDNLLTNKDTINSFAKKVAELIFNEISLGNCSQEFIYYLNTFLC